MDLIEKYLDKTKKVPEYQKGKGKKKKLPTLKYLRSIFGDDVIKDLKKGVDYE